jgi:hypothetical protein
MGPLLAQLAQFFSRVERFGADIARRQRLAAVLCGLLVLFVRAAELPRLPVPEPWVHDEFSFLLAADTFASGRLVNLTHPMWVHFESIHINQVPTYISMYPPGQGLALAAGQVVFGHPWAGVLLTTALFCWVLCWMLQGWLPPGWAFLGGMLVTMRIGVFTGTANSYFGTAVAGIGGALLLGALPRILRRPRAYHALLLGLGLAILANTRPYEGLLACIPVAIALLVWMVTRKPGLRVAVVKVILPLVLVVVPAAAATCYYCYRATGDPFRMPYLVNRETYAVTPYFLWQSFRPEPAYHHEVMRAFYVELEPGFQNAIGQNSLAGWLRAARGKVWRAWLSYLGFALTVPLIAFPCLFKDRRVRFFLLSAPVVLFGLGLARYTQPHYLMPMAGACYVIVLQSMRHMRQWRLRGHQAGLLLVRAVCFFCCAVFLGQVIAPYSDPPYPGNLQRAQVLRHLEGLPGRQLVIVRYGPEHDPNREWVYNRADIDHAKVVWAREMSPVDNQELLRYFRDRTAWLVEPDQQPPGLSPYIPLQ